MSNATALSDIATPSAIELQESRRYCEQLTRRQARNFYYGLRLLPEPKRSAMFALYSYMRLVDDIADGEDGRPVPQRAIDLDAWQARTHDALNGRPLAGDSESDSRDAIWPAFTDMVRTYGVPTELFEEAIAGQRQDLEFTGFDTFIELRDYCYRVAGVVGLASIYIWGFEGAAETEALAIDRGIAFQLTNILRDLREDAARGRVYLPRQELAAAGVTEDDLRSARGGKAFLDFMREQILRAEAYYASSRELEQRVSRDSRATLATMTAIYRGLLDKVSAAPERVLHERVSLSLLTKLRIGWKACRTQ